MGARERLRGLPVWDGRPIQKAPCFAYEVSALQKDVVNTGCLYSKSPDRRRPLHLRRPLPLRTLS